MQNYINQAISEIGDVVAGKDPREDDMTCYLPWGTLEKWHRMLTVPLNLTPEAAALYVAGELKDSSATALPNGDQGSAA